MKVRKQFLQTAAATRSNLSLVFIALFIAQISARRERGEMEELKRNLGGYA
jgi:hypothetical protein